MSRRDQKEPHNGISKAKKTKKTSKKIIESFQYF